MKKTKACTKWLPAAFSLLLVSFQAQALTLSPADGVSASGYSNLNTVEDINSAFGTYFSALQLLWSGETVAAPAPADPDGSLAASYKWTADSPANGGAIVYDSTQPPASCPTCILIVEDEQLKEASLLDLDTWDGTESIELEEFGEETGGTISSVGIWGGVTSVPEPGALMLMSLGLLGLVYSRKRKLD